MCFRRFWSFRGRTNASSPQPLGFVAIPREQLRVDDLESQIASEGFNVERHRLDSSPWSLEPRVVVELFGKVRRAGTPLSQFVRVKPYRGILTGLNEAFLIDTPTRNALVASDPSCAEVISPYIRGQDIKRWHPEWADLWMIRLKSSGDYAWPWSGAAGSDAAEAAFRETYPSLYARLKPMQEALVRRQDKGRYWWELRSCAYWEDFEKAKLVYQEIQFHPSYALDRLGHFGNNKTFFIPVADLYLLAVLNSPLLWWYNWRFLPHMKDESADPGCISDGKPARRGAE